MAQWPDEKIRSTALWYIRKHSMNPSTWRWTIVGEQHIEILALVDLQADELPIVSYFRTADSWYLLTTRRILGMYSGKTVEISPLDVVRDHFGNFKGHGERETEIMAFELANGSEVGLEFETNIASMAPIYYMMYWSRKYPILDKLKAEP